MLRLCPKDAWDIGVEFWSGNGNLAASVIFDRPVGTPVDKLLAALGDRDADKVAEQHPPLPIAVVLTDDVKRILMGREGDLLVTVLVDGRKAIRYPEHDCGGAVGEFEEVVRHAVRDWSFALGRRLRK